MSKNGLFETFESSCATGTKNKTQGLCCALKDLHSASDSDSEGEDEHPNNGKCFMFVYLMWYNVPIQGP